MPRLVHDILIRTIGGSDIGFMLRRDQNGRRRYSVQDAQTISPRFLTEEQISQQQLPPDLALTFPNTSWHRGIGGIRYTGADQDVLADGTRIDVTERGVIKLARNLVATTVDNPPSIFAPSGFAVSGSQLWMFSGRDVHSWDWTNKNWDEQTNPIEADRTYRNAVPFDGRLYAPGWGDDVGSSGSYVSADEPGRYIYKLLSDAQWTAITTSALSLEGCKYMAVADQKLWGGYWADAADSTIDLISSVTFDTASSGSDVANTTVTVVHACTLGGANRALFVVVCAEGTSAGARIPSGVTYNGVAMTQAPSPGSSNNGSITVSIWYIVAPATGANNIVATFAAAFQDCVVGGVSFTGVSQSSPIGTPVANTGTGTSISDNVTPTNGWVIDGVVLTASNDPTVGAGQTERFDVGTGGAGIIRGFGSTEPRPTAGGAVAMSWSWTGSTDWAHLAVAINEVTFSNAVTVITTTAAPESALAAGDVIRVENEAMLVTGVTPATPSITVVRGYRGTQNVSHNMPLDIYELTENVHQVRSTTNGTAMANWSTATSVGDSGSAITALVSAGEQLVVIKTDGIYTLEADGTVTNRLPGGPQMGHANFGKGAWGWNNLVFIPLHNGGLWELETETWTIRDISFSLSMPDQTQYHGRVVAGSGVPGRLYVVVQETATTSYHILMAQDPSKVGLTDYNWTQVGSIAYTTGTDPDHIAALLAGVTNGSNTHDRLWVGVESTGSNLLPYYLSNGSIDVDDEYSATSGEVYTVAFDAGFPNVLKRAMNIVLNTDNLGAVGGSNHYIDVRYRIDGGSWVYVHTGTGTNTSNGSSVTGDNQTITFSAGVTFRKIEFRFTLVRRTTGNQTTPELHDFTFTCQLRMAAIKLLPLNLYLANGLRLNNGMVENRAITNRNQLRTWNTQGAEVVVTDTEGGTRNMVFLPGQMREVEVLKLDKMFPEYEVGVLLAEV